MSGSAWVIESYVKALRHVHEAACLIEDAEVPSTDSTVWAARRRVAGALNEVYGDLIRLLGTVRDIAASSGNGEEG
ncbi:MAG: hypothetical protein ACRDTE_03170 [Pseudonocardiaceae bacterium]